MYAQNVVKVALCVSVLLLSCAVQAQKLSDLLVTKEAKPGLWAFKYLQIPKGLEAYLKPGSACATAEQLFESLSRSTQMVRIGKNGEKSCPTTIVSDKVSEANLKTICTKEHIGIDFEVTNTIKRITPDTWISTVSSPNSAGGMQIIETSIKYMGECQTK